MAKRAPLAVQDCETITGAAERTGTARQTLEAACDRGEIVYAWSKCGKERLLSPASVDRWIAAASTRRRGPKVKGG